MPLRTGLIVLALLWIQGASAEGFQPDRPGPSQSVHGGVGLIQVPTARFAEEGQLSLNYTDNNLYRFWSVSITPLPWMESTVRYTDVRNRLYSPNPGFSGNQTLKDKGIDVKFRLQQESRYLPELSLGFRDFGGTGLFESEYLAASKRWENFDFHLGLGWGYLGTSDNIANPFCQINASFCKRPGGYSGQGGQIDYQRFFKGTAALFGGIEYQTPWHPLRLKLEREGNNYSYDNAGVTISQATPWNAEAIYRWGNFDFRVNYQRGNTFGFGLAYGLNLHKTKQVRVDTPPRAVTPDPWTPQSALVQAEIRPNLPETMPQPAALDEVRDAKLKVELAREAGFRVVELTLSADEAILRGYQKRYPDQDEAIERIGRILAEELPRSIQRYRIVDLQSGLPVVETVIDAREFIRVVAYQTLEPDLASTMERRAPRSQAPEPSPLPESRFDWGMDTFWEQSFGSPEAFYIYRGGLIGNAALNLNAQTSLRGSLKVTLLDNFSTFLFKVDSLNTPLPRVRTRVREYVTRTDIALDRLYGHWHAQWQPNWYVQIYAGYLEMMFAGAGGELLYRPVDSRLALGVDLNAVRQRSVDDDFSLMDYSVLTGHLSAYWEPEFLPDMRLTTQFGQFLAGDRGVNIDVAKRFRSGIIVGAYAAFTNVSAEDYGEGSFTKGFYLSMPLDLFTPHPAKGTGRFPWIPISRDGGQMLHRPVKLMDTTVLRSRFGG